MSWDTEIVTMVRYLINDYGTTPKYSDDNIINQILISAIFVQQENSFTASYTVNLDNQTIRPDPTSSASRDESFLWLVTLKTCCAIAQSELKLAAGQAIAIKDEQSSIDLRGTLDGKKIVSGNFCADYTNASWKYSLDNRPRGAGIFGPFSLSEAGFHTMFHRDRSLFN